MMALQDCTSVNMSLKASLDKNLLTLSQQQQQQQQQQERGRLYDLPFAGKNEAILYVVHIGANFWRRRWLEKS